MKKYLLFMIAVTISINSCAQQGKDTKTASEEAEIIFNETDHNFGNIEFKGNGTFEFVFKNTGKTPLIVSNVQTSCGCTTPEYNKEPILPKKSGKIVVKYDTQRPFLLVKSIKVYSNAKNSPVELMIRGDVKVENKQM